MIFSCQFSALICCREISVAQDRVTALLKDIYRDQPGEREITRIILSAIGRGGQGDVGQRIRDEILVLQVNFYPDFWMCCVYI